MCDEYNYNQALFWHIKRVFKIIYEKNESFYRGTETRINMTMATIELNEECNCLFRTRLPQQIFSERRVFKEGERQW